MIFYKLLFLLVSASIAFTFSIINRINTMPATFTFIIFNHFDPFNSGPLQMKLINPSFVIPFSEKNENNSIKS